MFLSDIHDRNAESTIVSKLLAKVTVSNSTQEKNVYLQIDVTKLGIVMFFSDLHE